MPSQSQNPNNSNSLPEWLQKSRGKVVRIVGAHRGRAIAKVVATIEKGDKCEVSILFPDGTSSVVEAQTVSPALKNDEMNFNSQFQSQLRRQDAARIKAKKATV